MDINDTDAVIRALYRRLEPKVNSEELYASLQGEVAKANRRPTNRKLLRTLALACVALVVVAALGTGLFEAATHLGRSRPALVLTDQTLSSNGSGGASAGSLANPYPTRESASLRNPPTGSPSERPSAWADELGRAILKLYPEKRWGVSNAVELLDTPAVMDVTIRPLGTGDTASDAPSVPWIRVQVTRQEQGQLPQEGNPMRYPEFATDYGHGILVTMYGSQPAYLTSFVRPDKLLIQVSVGHASADTKPSTLLLDGQGVQKLTEYIASIIQLGDTRASSTTTSQPTSSTLAPVLSTQVEGYLDKLESLRKAAGVPVLDVGITPPDAQTQNLVIGNTKSSDVLPFVALEVPASLFASSDYMFMTDNIMRQTMVAIRQGVPLKYLGIIKVSDDGTKTPVDFALVYNPAQRR